MSSEEVSTLEKNGRSLKTRFDKASDRTERMVKRLNAARDELVKFKLVSISKYFSLVPLTSPMVTSRPSCLLDYIL